MLETEKSCIQTFRYHTSWSLPLMQASKAIRYFNHKVSLSKKRKVVPVVMDRALQALDLKDYTVTYEHILTERNLARITLRNHLKNSESMREIELRKRAEKSALEGDEKVTRCVVPEGLDTTFLRF